MSRIRYQASRLATRTWARIDSTRALEAQAQALRTDIARVQCAISNAATGQRRRPGRSGARRAPSHRQPRGEHAAQTLSQRRHCPQYDGWPVRQQHHEHWVTPP